MPIYEYRCESCGHELEKLQRMSDPLLKDCPECGKARLRRLISAAGFRLKGAGWYETDFKQGNKRNLAESPADSKDEAGAKGAAGGNGGDTGKTEPAGSKSDKAAKTASSGGASEKSSGASSKTPGSGSAADRA
jgi:putative FmdB family regulatory protein